MNEATLLRIILGIVILMVIGMEIMIYKMGDDDK